MGKNLPLKPPRKVRAGRRCGDKKLRKIPALDAQPCYPSTAHPKHKVNAPCLLRASDIQTLVEFGLLAV
jgi:hypothetical protein